MYHLSSNGQADTIRRVNWTQLPFQPSTIGEYTKAIADITRYLDLAPNSSRGYYVRGSVYSYQGDLTAAIADFETAIQLNPTYAAAYHALGIAYADSGNTKEAAKQWQIAADLYKAAGDSAMYQKMLELLAGTQG